MLRDEIEKKTIKKGSKKITIKKMRNKIEKQNEIKCWEMKLKKKIKKNIQSKTNCNKKNEDQILYKNIMNSNVKGWNWKTKIN